MGGVLSAEESDVRVFQSNFSNNLAICLGGVFFSSQSDFNIESCTFTNNEVQIYDNYGGPDAGAALHIENNSTVKITGSVFTHNSAKSGCIYANYSKLHVHSSQFLSNTAIYGGAFTIRHGKIHINGYNNLCDSTSTVEFINNSAEYGGAMNIIDSSVASIHCARFANNSAGGKNDSRGGAILARTNTKVSLVDTQFCLKWEECCLHSLPHSEALAMWIYRTTQANHFQYI